MPTAVIRSAWSKELPQFVPRLRRGVVVHSVRRPPAAWTPFGIYLDAQGAIEVGPKSRSRLPATIECIAPSCGRPCGDAHPLGAYGTLSEAHARSARGALRIQCAGISWELYGHGRAWNTDSSKMRTDVFYLLDDSKG